MPPSKLRRALIIGCGSAGRRHLSVLSDLGHECAVVSGADIDGTLFFQEIKQALVAFKPDYVVVANETALHSAALLALGAGKFAGICMVEKPLFRDFEPELALEVAFPVFVGYNLRFHPVVQRFRADTSLARPIAVRAYVGQYLPDWRPGTPLEKSYSISRERGGGVLRDLSHELDFLLWSLGPWKRVIAMGGKLSNLPGDSEDCVSILMETERCRLVEVQLNYLDRKPQREILTHFAGHTTLRYDLMANTIDDKSDALPLGADGYSTTRRMHEAVLRGLSKDGVICTFEEALEVNKLIEAIELSMQSSSWVVS